MSAESLEAAIRRAGSPVTLLRNSPVRPHTFPVAPEFTNWRSEQRAWRTTCALLDQSHHLTDLYLSGPDALKPREVTGAVGRRAQHGQARGIPAGAGPGRRRTRALRP